MSSFTTTFEPSTIRMKILSSRRAENLSDQELHDGCKLGADSHADVSVAGKHGRIISFVDGQLCTVHPFHDGYQPKKNVKIVNVAFAYDHQDGITYILVLNHCLDFTKDMQDSLFSTNQVRANGIIVDDVPKCFDVEGNSRQAILIPEKNIQLSLQQHGPTLHLPVRYPTQSEMDECERIELTSSSGWNPYDSSEHVRAIKSDVSHYGDDSTTQVNDAVELFSILQNKIQISALTTTVKGELNSSYLSRLWNISLDSAKRTLGATKQNSMHIIKNGLTRRRMANKSRLDHKRLSGYLSDFASDTFMSNVTSTRGNKYVQLFVNRGGYVQAYPMERKGQAHEALDKFLMEVGLPGSLLTDGAKELTKSAWGKLCRKHKIPQRTTEPHCPWQNFAEPNGGAIKRAVRYLMRKNNTPVRLWDYCWEYYCGLKRFIVTPNLHLQGSTPYEKIHGVMPNITEYIQYNWFEWIWYADRDSPDDEDLGRWLGPAFHAGEGHTSYILKKNGEVITRSSLRPMKEGEMDNPETKRRCEDFTKEMESHIGNYVAGTFKNHDAYGENPYDNMFEDDELDDEDILPQEVDGNGDPIPRIDVDYFLETEPPFMENDDEHIGLELTLPNQGVQRKGRVVKRKRNENNELIGKAHENPMLDTRIYEIDFGDGTYHEYTTNLIMENLYSQVDDDGNQYGILKGITNAKSDETAVLKANAWITMPNQLRRRRITTKGWKIKVLWEDGSESWLPLAIVKESNPIELAEFAIAKGIEKEPAFAWWVPQVLKKRSHFIQKLRTRVSKSNLKFGLVVPKTVEEALSIDKANGDKFWHEAIKKELKNVIVAFHLLGEDETVPVGSKLIPYHIIFDIKYDLTRKARLVAGGHRNKDVPSHITYSSVVSRETVRLGFLIAAMNGLNVSAADIGNAYLNAPCAEKVHVVCGPELFGDENKGKIAVIVRALYGLKSAGASWRAHLSSVIQSELKYTPSKGDPDMYMKRKIKSNGEAYYSYLIVYVDDLLSIDIDPDITIRQIGETFRIKEGSVGFPNMYLGANIRKWQAQNTAGEPVDCIAMGPNSYIKEAVRVVEARMKEYKLSFASKRYHNTPFTSSAYRPELDATEFCEPSLIGFYQNLMGILRWACEIGRLDVLLESSLLSQYMVAPREGHLAQALNIFAYLKAHDRSWMVFDPNKFDIEWSPMGNEVPPRERAEVMSRIYPDAKDVNPPGMPEPLGVSIQLTMFVDADHAGNQVTRRSHTGILIFGNMAPIQWYSKRQNTVESSTFGSEFVALRTAVELMEGIRYKLKMLGVPLEGETRVLCDNQSVIKNGSFPESVLKKKHCSVAYHVVREHIAAKKALLFYENTKSNLADLFTKVLNADTRKRLLRGILN